MNDGVTEEAKEQTNCISSYQKALEDLYPSNDSSKDEYLDKQKWTEKFIAILVARDIIHVALSDKSANSQQPTDINLLIQLDKRLREKAKDITQRGQLAEWRKSVNPLPEQWWWYLKSPSLNEAVNEYSDLLNEYDAENDPWYKDLWNWVTMGKLNHETEADQAIQVLLAREAVEEALKCESPSDNLIRTIIGLDIKLKNHSKEIARRNQLVRWKNSFKHFSDNWWWNLKPTAMTSPEEPQSLWEGILNAVTIAFLVGATSFTISSAKVFKDSGNFGGVGGIGVTGLQAVLLGVVAKGTLTTEGRKSIEKFLITIDAPPKQQTLVVLFCSGALFVLTLCINLSLPFYGYYFYAMANNFESEEDLKNAEKNYTRAAYFNTNGNFGSVIYVRLGQLKEKQNDLTNSLKNYEKAFELSPNNPAALEGQARVLLFQEWEKYAGKINNNKSETVIYKINQKLAQAQSLYHRSNNENNENKDSNAEFINQQSKNENKDPNAEFINQQSKNENKDPNAEFINQSLTFIESKIYLTKGILNLAKSDNGDAIEDFDNGQESLEGKINNMENHSNKQEFNLTAINQYILNIFNKQYDKYGENYKNRQEIEKMQETFSCYKILVQSISIKQPPIKQKKSEINTPNSNSQLPKPTLSPQNNNSCSDLPILDSQFIENLKNTKDKK
ncbi:MAG: hypothetical protein V7K69_15810 [Nostoc sp.]|uniref:tetratricopeptide repeat protein n=1 Tax=Nostoc sp. TaxID=1180 RepID=UPI002FF6DE02